MHFYCQCLNVTIDVLEINSEQHTLALHDLASCVKLPQGWFECKIPSEETIHIVWRSLVQSMRTCDIKLHRCLICNQYTHITNTEANRILVNNGLLNDETVTRAYLDPNYSKVTKIILPSGAVDPTTTDLTSSHDEIFQREYNLAQQLYRQTIEDADRETEEKIQMYQYEQEQLLRARTETIYKELDTFLRFMQTIPRHASSTKTLPTSQKSKSYIHENSAESGFGSDIFDTNGADLSRPSSTTDRRFSEHTSNLDDETDDDPMLDNTAWFTSKDSPSNFARSLPKDIAFPSYSIPEKNDDEDDDDNNDNINDLERIGKSFRQLNQSLVCADGTELFGDLPPPRLNARQT